MAEGKYVSYLRVSTQKQGASGLGLEAQRKAVEGFLNGGRWIVIKELLEIESGKRDDRPKLAEAMQLCRIHGATLVIAKLDRLSRDAHFLLGLQKAGIQFVAADQPFANELTIGLLAVVAQHERKMISARTKAALAAKASWYKSLTDEQRAKLVAENRPVQLGGNRGKLADIGDGGRVRSLEVRRARARHRASDLMPTITELRGVGITSLAALADALTARGIPTARGASTWSPMQVSRVLQQATA